MKRPRDPRTTALRRFAASITIFTIVGHTLLGFEQAYITPVVAVLAAYAIEFGLETVDAWAHRRPPKYAGGPVAVIDFLLPAHISGLACAMLLYANSRLGPVIFAVAIAIASKYLVRVTIRGRQRHVLNPSNLGIAVVLVLFPWVGIAPPYHFTEWLIGPWDWILPIAILASGTMLNAQLTKKVPLILGWIGGFAVQAVVRTLIDGTSTLSALLVMTGTAFILFTNYMITDPATSPVPPRRQFAFGAATAAVYGLLVHFHIVYGLFFALVIVCVLRAAGLAVFAWWERRTQVQRARPRVAAEPAFPEPRAAVGTSVAQSSEAR
jgi:hypothetical protein